ncbi:MAG: HDOD domain-containing protein [Rhodocyclales bacterium GT-UBC]|nr:MAG: HDOD domain-containing protein [Rhodocyclales bacterium GT-UBC]
MSPLDREQVVSHLKQLPSLPSVVSELLASFGNDDIDVGRIAQQIAHDQGLTARVLRVANSSFYGLQSRVGTINEAVVVLGFRAVRSMVLAVGMSGALRLDQCQGFDGQAYLRHCVAVGLAARAIAPFAGHNPELAFTAGILHDIGELVLASSFPEQYAAVLAYRAQHDCFMVVAERDILGLDHAEVGGLLADTWHFPSSLRDAVALHHQPASAPAGSLADLIHVADGIAHALGMALAQDEMVMPVERTAWLRLGLDSEKLGRILPQVESDMDATYQAIKG